jgi:H/ACA ribonucleoprotein complex subunit 4
MLKKLKQKKSVKELLEFGIKSVKELLEFGIINIDKPSGPTSFDVSELVMKKLSLRKTSHFGTLDPKVTGVLPVALNRACKLTGYFIGEDKEYVGIMRIHRDVALKEIEKAIKEKFTGKITQLPPVKSRIKRQERQREIKSFKILEKDGQNILFRAEVEGGTYIRKLISDLGDYMKIGAHMLELRRVRAGIFKEETSVNLYDFEKAIEDENKLKEIIIPGEIITDLYPVVQIKNEYLSKVLHGSPIHDNFLSKKIKFKSGESICIFSDIRFVGVYQVINQNKIFAKPLFVLQPIGK